MLVVVVLAGGAVPSAGAQSEGSGGVVLVVVNGSSLADVGVAAGLVGGGVGDVVVAAESAGGLGESAGGVVRAAGVVSGVVLVGGEAALGGAVAAELESLAPGVVVERVSGADRVATAAAAARRVLAGRSGGAAAGVVLADGWSLADVGVAAAVVAAGGADVVLYSGSGSLPDQTRQVLAGEAVGGIVVVGGAAAVPDSVVAAAAGAAGGVGTERVGGKDRVATAALAARRWAPGCAEAAVIANGWSQADVGTAAALAAALGDSVVLYTASADGLGSDTRSALGRVRPQLAVVVGDTDTISNSTADELAELGYPAARVTDAAAAARYALDNDLRNCRTTTAAPRSPTGTETPNETSNDNNTPDNTNPDTDNSTPQGNTNTDNTNPDTDNTDNTNPDTDNTDNNTPDNTNPDTDNTDNNTPDNTNPNTDNSTPQDNTNTDNTNTDNTNTDNTNPDTDNSTPQGNTNPDNTNTGDVASRDEVCSRPSAWFSPSRVKVTEGGAAETITVELSEAPTVPVTFQLNLAHGDAVSNDDYVLSHSTLAFGAAQTQAAFRVAAADDSRLELDETLTFSLAAPSNPCVRLSSSGKATVTLVDADTPDVGISFSSGSYRVEEGGAPVTVTVELSEAPQREVTVPLKVALRGAGRRYSLSRSALAFAADQTSATFTVTVADDGLNNDGHRLSLSFGDLPPRFTAVDPRTATVDIVDDEIGVRLQRVHQYAYEGGSDAQVRVSIDSPPEETITITLTADLRGGAVADDISYSVEDLSFDFGAGETQKTITVTAVDDSDDDDGEYVVFALGDLPDGVLSTSGTSLTIRLVDNDGLFSRQPEKDFTDLYPAEVRETNVRVRTDRDPNGLWSDGTTMWVLFEWVAEFVAAYDMNTRALDPNRIFDTEDSNFYNRTPQPFDLWSDGDTLWVADHLRCFLFAFDLATLTHNGDLDVDMSGHHGSRFCEASGIWSDGDTVWVAEDSHDKIFAYSLATGERRSQHDITTIAAAGATSPSALWSDGVTMWVADRHDKRVYAFDLDSGARRSDLELTPTVLDWAGVVIARGIWSDGATMWVSDIKQEWHCGDPQAHFLNCNADAPGKIYAFSMPVSAALESLSVSGADFGLFQTGIFAYEGTAAAGATSATVTAAAAFADNATVTVAWEAADGTTGTGTSATLSAGDNTITVTSSYDADGDADTDNADVRVYTVTVTVPAADDS